MSLRSAVPLFVFSSVALSGCGNGGNLEPGVEADTTDVATVGAALDATEAVASVDDLIVHLPPRFNLAYDGTAAAEFPDGLPLSIGSGLRLERHGQQRCPCSGEGEIRLVGLADRGPNGDAPDYLDAAGVRHPSKSYLAPNFAPRIVSISLRHGAAPVVTRAVALGVGRRAAVGLPPSSMTPEVGLSDTLSAFASSAAGVDPEGIDFDARGNAWLCEEYGPSLLEVNPQTGQISRRLTPTSGLPPILASRQVNRGFEGVAVAPSGNVYALVQSTLDVDAKTKGTAQFIRVLEYNPRTGATRMFAYPHDVAAYKKSGDAKLGDLVAVDDTHFLLIEEGKGAAGLRNIVYEIDLGQASDLTGVVLTSGPNAGKELEYGTLAEVTAQISMASKTQLVDLRANGWTPEKAEGMTLVDAQTLIVANDQDFGVTAVLEGDATGGTDPTKYVVDSSGQITFNGAPSPGSYAVHALAAADQQSHLFVVHLTEPIPGYACH
jgi:hypothetical protein